MLGHFACRHRFAPNRDRWAIRCRMVPGRKRAKPHPPASAKLPNNQSILSTNCQLNTNIRFFRNSNYCPPFLSQFWTCSEVIGVVCRLDLNGKRTLSSQTCRCWEYSQMTKRHFQISVTILRSSNHRCMKWGWEGEWGRNADDKFLFSHIPPPPVTREFRLQWSRGESN